jgi:hypothetical protein
MKNLVIVRRAFSQYTPVASYLGRSRLDALLVAMKMQADNNDGEYFVRTTDEPDWKSPSSYQQSGLDYL